VSKKIRDAQLGQYNYILTVGDREVECLNIAVRTRDNVVHGQMEVDAFLKIITQECSEKQLTSPMV
jgi:threonyl-tRNA synthetase